MRYHWGIGVGHLHAHQSLSTNNGGSISDELIDIRDDQNADDEPDNILEHASSIDGASMDSESLYKSDNSEWDWEDVETDIGNDLDYRGEHELENSDEDSDVVGQ